LDDLQPDEGRLITAKLQRGIPQEKDTPQLPEEANRCGWRGIGLNQLKMESLRRSADFIANLLKLHRAG